MTDPTTPPPQTKPKRNRKIGPEAKAEAYRLLAEGYAVRAVGRMLKVQPATILNWRDLPEGQQYLAAARKSREAAYADAVADAARILRDNATKAAQTLVDTLEDPMGSRRPPTQVKAATEILDRIGLPRTERVETKDTTAPDLSALSDEELTLYEALTRKITGGK